MRKPASVPVHLYLIYISRLRVDVPFGCAALRHKRGIIQTNPRKELRFPSPHESAPVLSTCQGVSLSSLSSLALGRKPAACELLAW